MHNFKAYDVPESSQNTNVCGLDENRPGTLEVDVGCPENGFLLSLITPKGGGVTPMLAATGV